MLIYFRLFEEDFSAETINFYELVNYGISIEWKEEEKEAVEPSFMDYVVIRVEGIKKTKKNMSRGNWFRAENWNHNLLNIRHHDW